MAQKITAKNLSYDASLPPFLAALRAQAAGHTQRPAPQRRGAPKKRSASEELEDAPLVVDEHGNAIDLRAQEEQPDADLGPEAGLGEGRDGATTTTTTTTTSGRRSVPQSDAAESARGGSGIHVALGAGKKRRVGKVVGGEADGLEDERQGRRGRGEGGGETTMKKTTRPSMEKKTEKKTDDRTDSKIIKKKAKKIKLSFDEAEG